jgi:hypothetical protein
MNADLQVRPILVAVNKDDEDMLPPGTVDITITGMILLMILLGVRPGVRLLHLSIPKRCLAFMTLLY